MGVERYAVEAVVRDGRSHREVVVPHGDPTLVPSPASRAISGVIAGVRKP